MIGVGSVEHPLLVQIGITLAHFIWQGAVIALLLAIGLWLLRRRTAGERYVACSGALLLMVLCPVVTMIYVHNAPLAIRTAEETAPETAPLVLDSPGDDVTGHVVAWAPTTERETGAGSVVEPTGEELASDGHTTDSPRADAATALPDSASSTPAARRWTSVRLPSNWLATGFALAALAWSIGVALLALRMMLGWVSLRRLRRKAEPLAAQVDQIVRRLRERLGLSSSVRVMATPTVSEPIAFGLFRPIVLVPISLMTNCPVELVEAWIAHELAHIRRYDLWFNLFQRVVETLLFYHPAVWWVSRRMRLERELCCDDLAVAVTGRRPEYAEALVEVARVARSSGSPMLAAGVIGANVTLLARVRRVLQLPQPPQQSRFWLAGPLSLLLVAAVLVVARIQGAPTDVNAERSDVAEVAREVESPPALPIAQTPPEPRASAPAQRMSQESRSGRKTPAGEPEQAQEPAVPSSELPETSVIETDLVDELESYRNRLREQRVVLLPAVEVGRAFHAFRDALWTSDTLEMQRRLTPGGKAATEYDVKALLSDMQQLKIDVELHEAWTIDYVYVLSDRSAAAVLCAPFTVRHDDRGWQMRISCRLLPDDELRWTVSRLSVRSTEDKYDERERFFDEMARRLSPDDSPKIYRVSFYERRSGETYPGSCTVYELQVERVRRGTGEEAERRKWEQLTSMGFEGPLGQWKCFEPAPSPEPAPPEGAPAMERPAAYGGVQGPELPSAELPPRTSLIKTDYEALKERAAGDRAAVEEQRAILLPAVAVVRAVYAFRDALYDGKMAEVRRRFKPGGKAASEGDIKRLLDDLRTLGIEGKRYEAWTVSPVWVLEDKSGALAVCSPFVVEREGVQWTMRVSCQLVPGEEEGWVITRLSVSPDRDKDRALERFLDESVTLSEERPTRSELWSVTFDNRMGQPSRYHTVSVWRQALSSGERWFRQRSSRPLSEFDAPLREWQCFEPQPVPAPPRPSRPRRSEAAEARKRAEAAAREELVPPPKRISIPVRTLADGLIAEVKVNEGQAVKKGDLLVRLDDEEILLELQAAEVRLQAAKAAYDWTKKMFDGGRASDEESSQTRSTLQLAELDVRRWQLRLERTHIASPADGKIHFLREPLSPGQKVSAGDLLLYVVKQENGSTGEAEPTKEENRVGDTADAGAPK